MWLAHHSHDCNPGRRSDWLRNKLRYDVFLVVLRYRCNDRGQRWLIAEAVLLCHLSSQAVEVDVLLQFGLAILRLEILDESIGDIGAGSQISFVLGRQLLVLQQLDLQARPQRCHRLSHHVDFKWKQPKVYGSLSNLRLTEMALLSAIP